METPARMGKYPSPAAMRRCVRYRDPIDVAIVSNVAARFEDAKRGICG